ncbi:MULTISPECIES: bifunctional phosphopantothenoylcysteine decarboxylase/phosphopantothenate--cysteine ligase CoaBC [Dietzia]|uniref:Coenzyme A biosynthesis bifunctional protein CoaBC n=1 Tax=Dietzia cinnamea TaxID=321318 RepID=A0A4V2W8F7_9ACTN|nr:MULTISPECIES: bifunctional phosphopantothenoylcysteine decarboxylase/phosphopantothenate--cysteine ligase CoaBC [Dietzia]MCT1884169.1 bifunctional phosphopantothenoylcysteine decarboxylase/phosphopantothenate--cysteine ligase CoaBC [Dietzia cinnamea]MCT2120723.1 bifunctional phosphopantothenoylcysteine decarboxylase/phosphopantothenate--cysteine ligase CoaBC [Dietzia cinnamea]MCT2139065.1 bifunctional phosphopantothenoylcysteine decarboxylase/phosphopantothenate--cysteine ligase CoaBC [Dietzi
MSPTGDDMRGKRVVVGVGGGIAAYKACGLIRLLTESGCHVDVVPTEAALRFVGSATFEALSGNPVSTGVFSDVPSVRHVALGQRADLVVVAPATADLLARAASGRADDLLTSTLLTARCPVLLAPAMHTEMWEHPATRRNVDTLRGDGVHVMPPASGRLTGADTGAGRLPEPSDIARLAWLFLDGGTLPWDLAGRRVVVTSGGTREEIDPVRFLGNRSSGKQGHAIAAVAAARGARVTLVTSSDLPVPAAVEAVHIESALQLREETLRAAAHADVVVKAAAVADFRPADVSESKLKKGSDSEPAEIRLQRNPDILADLVAARSAGDVPASCVLVGFAAETGDSSGSVLEHGRAKLARKGCDLLVVNEVGRDTTFGRDDNGGWILDVDGAETTLDRASKDLLADRLLDAVAAVSLRRTRRSDTDRTD